MFWRPVRTSLIVCTTIKSSSSNASYFILLTCCWLLIKSPRIEVKELPWRKKWRLKYQTKFTILKLKWRWWMRVKRVNSEHSSILICLFSVILSVTFIMVLTFYKDSNLILWHLTYLLVGIIKMYEAFNDEISPW